MKLIVGLGNPGEEYTRTRHNIGFVIADMLAAHYGSSFSFKKDFEADIAQARIGENEVMIAKPHTFMNNSGNAVRKIAHFYKIPSQDIIVLHDDLDTALGVIKYVDKLQESGSGGHNGVKSITQELGTAQFSRIKIGVKTQEVDDARASDRKEEKEAKIDHFVLSPFTKEEYTVLEPQLKAIIESMPEYLK